MTNRLPEFPEEGSKSNDALKDAIAQKVLPCIGGIAYTGIRRTSSQSFSHENPHTFLRYEFWKHVDGTDHVSFFYQKKDTQEIIRQHGPIDRCGVTRYGTTDDCTIAISFAQSGEEWYVDPPYLGRIAKALGPIEGN